MGKCVTHGKRWCKACILATLAFPVEHALWTHAPVFRTVTQLIGL